jgi:hypothetical protein
LARPLDDEDEDEDEDPAEDLARSPPEPPSPFATDDVDFASDEPDDSEAEPDAEPVDEAALAGFRLSVL